MVCRRGAVNVDARPLPSATSSHILGAMSARGTLAVVLPAWKEAAELPATMEALASATHAFAEVRVAVVAGGDEQTIRTAREALDRHRGLRGILVTQRPLGKMAALADGMEALAAEGASDWVLTLDADTWVLPHSLERAVTFLEERPDLAGVGPRLLLAPSGAGAAHDLVNRAIVAGQRSVTAVGGHAVLFRGELLWPRWRQVFGPHDYPLHIDYQMCERLVHATVRGFAIAPGFEVRTPRARGWAFLREERRHHRAMFARLGLRRGGRYLLGAVATCSLPVLPVVVGASAVSPVMWPLGAVAAGVALQRLRRYRREHAEAKGRDPQAARTSLGQYARDEWVFAITALLGAVDWLRERSPEPTFRGVRR